jgi:hypothetical protein
MIAEALDGRIDLLERSDADRTDAEGANGEGRRG